MIATRGAAVPGRLRANIVLPTAPVYPSGRVVGASLTSMTVIVKTSSNVRPGVPESVTRTQTSMVAVTSWFSVAAVSSVVPSAVKEAPPG